MDLNVKAPFFLTRAFLPLLEAAATREDPARVINIGTIDGLRRTPMPRPTRTRRSKAAMHQLTRLLARELGPGGSPSTPSRPGRSSRR